MYFGGGTPSLFHPASIQRVLDHPALSEVEEITLEVNPGTVEYHSLEDYVKAGVNRVSLGVQSLHDHFLKALGRIHSVRDAYTAVEEAKQSGFRSINLDLMYGLPHQSVGQAMRGLDKLIQQEPDHISWYQLTIEPNTQFYSAPPTVASDDQLADMADLGLEKLTAAGYERYEISAYARPGHRCSHNMNYWRFGDYIGIGAGAHGKITNTDGSILRTRKKRQPDSYMSDQAGLVQEVPRAELPVEFMMNVLRLRDGANEEHFANTTGLSIEVIEPVLIRLREEGLMHVDRIQLTERGYEGLNAVVERFMEI